MRIGVVSDTHDLLRDEVVENLRGCDCILHGGDIGSRKVLERLSGIAPVRVVRGNNDREWAEGIPQFLDAELCGIRVYMTHKKKDLPKELGVYDLVVCGHTHRYASEWLVSGKNGKRTLLLNPGSCGPGRFRQPVTMAVIEIGKNGLAAERIDIPHKPAEILPETDPGNIRTQIDLVIRATQKGMSVDAVAEKYRMDPALAEQIARLYVTHPGVTADGIMAKMGL